MEVQPTRPTNAAQETTGHRKTETNEAFASTSEEASGQPSQESDANTRLSREPDAVELSEEGRELSRRFEQEPE